VAVEAVVGDVGLAVDEPAGVWVIPLLHSAVGGEPVELPCNSVPEPFRVPEKILVCRCIVTDPTVLPVGRVGRVVLLGKSDIKVFSHAKPRFTIIIDEWRKLRVILFRWRKERERDSTGAILANRDDFELAKTLWTGIGRELVGKLTKDDLRFLNCIKEKGDKAHDGIYTIPRQIAKRSLSFSDYKMDAIINGRNGTGGLREKVEGFDIEKGTKTTGDEYNKRTVHCDVLKYDGSLDVFGQFNDLVWIVE